ncbi:MAG: DNA-methyltransferase [Pseudohongiellaceae bacterium]
MPRLNSIALEDCLIYLQRLKPESVDLAIADPPYNMGKDDWDSFPSKSAFYAFTEEWIDAMLPALKPGGCFYIFNTPVNCAYILQMLEARDTTILNWITWHKRDGLGGGRRKYACNQETILFGVTGQGNRHHFDADAVRVPYQSESRMRHAEKKGILKNGQRWYPHPDGRMCSDVWEFSSHRHKTKVNGRLVKPTHPTPKPEDMIERMVLASSAPGDLVLDLFSGTGTTAAVCRKLGRNFLGYESNPKFHTLARKRIRSVNANFNLTRSSAS